MPWAFISAFQDVGPEFPDSEPDRLYESRYAIPYEAWREFTPKQKALIRRAERAIADIKRAATYSTTSGADPVRVSRAEVLVTKVEECVTSARIDPDGFFHSEERTDLQDLFFPLVRDIAKELRLAKKHVKGEERAGRRVASDYLEGVVDDINAVIGDDSPQEENWYLFPKGICTLQDVQDAMLTGNDPKTIAIAIVERGLRERGERVMPDLTRPVRHRLRGHQAR